MEMSAVTEEKEEEEEREDEVRYEEWVARWEPENFVPQIAMTICRKDNTLTLCI